MAVINVAAVAAAAAAEVPKIIRDGIEREIQGKPSFIADGMPESVPGQIGQAAARSACRQYAAGNSGLTGVAAVNAETACRPYLDDIYPPTGPAVKTPFQGGQCPDSYLMTWSATNGDDTNSGATVLVRGPVGGVRYQELGASYQYQVFSHGLSVGSTSCGPLADSGGAWRNLGGGAVLAKKGTVSITNLSPCGLDNCGNPPPEVTQPRTDPDPVGKPFRFNPSPFIDLPIDVTINPDGTIGVDIGTGPITVDGFNGSGSGGEAPGAEPGTAGQGGDTGAGNAGTSEGGEASGEAPPGSVLTGVKVNILTAPPTRVRYTTEVDRGVVYCYMGTPAEGLALETSGSLTRDGQFFPAQKDYFTSWQVRARFGYNVRCTPFYREAP